MSTTPLYTHCELCARLRADNRRPFLHWPTWMAELRAERYRSNWGAFIVTMAMCALSAGKLADGSVQASSSSLKARAASLSSECYHAAVQAVHRDDDFDLGDGRHVVPLLKARALLSSTCMQAGNLNAALAHNGEYSIVSALAGFHDEANWPSDLTEIQRQERRRLVSATVSLAVTDSSFGSRIRPTSMRQHVSAWSHDTAKHVRTSNTQPKSMTTSWARTSRRRVRMACRSSAGSTSARTCIASSSMCTTSCAPIQGMMMSVGQARQSRHSCRVLGRSTHTTLFKWSSGSLWTCHQNSSACRQ